MGVPTDIYSLHEITLAGESIKRLLLTRVRRRGFANWNQVDEDHAGQRATEDEELLVRQFLAETSNLAVGYDCRKIGELQCAPVGDILLDPGFQGEVQLWVASTSHGPPWVVLGTATSEKAFWEELYADDDLVNLEPLRPARRIRAHYLQTASYPEESPPSSR